MNKFVRVFNDHVINLNNVQEFRIFDSSIIFKFNDGRERQVRYKDKEGLQRAFLRLIEFLDNDKQLLDLTKTVERKITVS